MALGGVYSGEFDIVSPADRFFEVVVEVIRDQYREFVLLDMDKERKTVVFSMGGFLIPISYVTARTTIKVTPREDEAEGSRVTWKFEFQKVRHDIVNPHFIIDLFVSYLNAIDRNRNL